MSSSTRPKVAKVAEGLYIGNVYAARVSPAELDDNYGIQAAVSACSSAPHPDLPTAEVPTFDGRMLDEDMLAWVQKVVAAIHEMLTKHERVMVYCVEGVNRSATALVAYLMTYRELSFEAAKQAVIQGKWDAMWPTLTNEYFHQFLEINEHFHQFLEINKHFHQFRRGDQDKHQIEYGGYEGPSSDPRTGEMDA